MEKIISISVACAFGAMATQFFKYNRIKNLDHKIKTSINIDTSYEKFVGELDNKTLLIATSISKINKNKGEILDSLILGNQISSEENLQYCSV
jgi:hypothetical protein